MLNIVNLKQSLDAITAEKKILENDLTVMNIILKNILNSKIVTINGKQYFEANDIINICKEGFESLSSKMMKEKPMS